MNCLLYTSINKIKEKVEERRKEGKLFTIIVVAEGAKPKDGEVVVSKIVADSPDPIRLGGIGNKLADDLEKIIPDHEVRCTVLGLSLIHISPFRTNLDNGTFSTPSNIFERVV